MLANEVLIRNNVHIIGTGEETILMAYGFGCDQSMWRFLTPSFESNYRIVLFDYVGSGSSSLADYTSRQYSTLEGYSQDITDVCDALNLQKIHFIGHSVSCMIGLIASIQRPDLFSSMTMVCPSPSFLNDPPKYLGGFERRDLEELITLMDKNYIGWAQYLAPLVLGVQNSDTLLGELTGSFCTTDPVVAKNFAKATFFEDHRELLGKTPLPCLILQSANDSLAPVHVGEYMNHNMSESTLHIVEAQGHCLHMTDPKAIDLIIIDFLKTHTESKRDAIHA